MHNAFHRFAKAASSAMGKPWAFVGYLLAVALWSAAGPLLGFSDTWQLVANTFTTLVTTALVLLVQHTQNTNDALVHQKLDRILAQLDSE